MGSLKASEKKKKKGAVHSATAEWVRRLRARGQAMCA